MSEQEAPGEAQRKRSRRRLAVAVSVGLLVVLFFAPWVPVSQTYIETEHYQRPLTYQVTESPLSPIAASTTGLEPYGVTVKNTDRYGGVFTVQLKLRKSGQIGTIYETAPEETVYLEPNETCSSNALFYHRENAEGSYSVKPPSVPDVRLVTKERLVYKSPVQILIEGNPRSA